MSQANDSLIQALKNRITELEDELVEKSNELSVFRMELLKANAQIERMIQQVSHEVQLASDIQKIIVPTEFPTIPGFEFSSKFIASQIKGGDYFDIFEHEDKFRFGIILSNCSGYGLSALLLSVLLRFQAQPEARRGKVPSELMKTIANELLQKMSKDDEANIVYLLVDRRKHELTVCSCGEIYFGLLRQGENEVNVTNDGNIKIKKDSQLTFKQSTIQLAAKDRLVIASEGLQIAQSPDGDPFGINRINKAIITSSKGNVHDTRNELFFQLEQHSRHSDLARDVTVIVMDVKDRVIKLAKSPSSF